LAARTDAQGNVSLRVLSSDIITQDISIQAIRTLAGSDYVIGTQACDFGELLSYRRFRNQYDPEEVEDTGWLLDFPHLEALDGITPAKVYLKFRKDLDVLDIDGNWHFVKALLHESFSSRLIL